MSSDCEPRHNETSGEGCVVGFELSWVSWGFGVKALGEMYGDCRAETNADEGGETRDGELYGEDSIEFFKFGEGKVSLPVSWLLQVFVVFGVVDEAILMVSPLETMVSRGVFWGALADFDACFSSSMAICSFGRSHFRYLNYTSVSVLFTRKH